MESKELKIKIIEAGKKAVAQLIKVAKEDIIKYDSYSSSDGPKIFDNKYSYSSDSKKPTYNNAKKPNNVIKI